MDQTVVEGDAQAEASETSERARDAGRSSRMRVVTAAVRPSRSRLRAWGAVGGGAALIALHAAYYGRWLIDDAAVTFAYARDLTAGHGFTLQPGAPDVEAYSNPFWMLLLALGRLLGLFDHGSLLGLPDYVLFPKALATLCILGTLAGVYTVAKAVSRRPALCTFAVGATLALIPSFVIWCYSGLENSLYALLVTWIAATMVRRRDALHAPGVAVLIGALVAGAALTRPDGVIYVLAYPLVLLIRRDRGLRHTVRSVLFSLCGFAVLYGAYMAVRLAEFGKLVPNTAVAKAQAVPLPTNLSRVDDLVRYAGPTAVAFLLVCAVLALLAGPEFRRLIGPVLAVLGLAVTAYCVLNADWMPQLRFATPVWVLGTLTGWLCVERAFRDRAFIGRAWIAALGAAVLGISAPNFLHDAQRFHASPTTPMCWVADRYGEVINSYGAALHLPAGSTLLLPDVGGTALTSNYRILDLAGLANTKIATYQNTKDLSGLRDYVFDVLKPTIIAYHGPWREGMQSDPRLTRDYYLIYTQAGSNIDGDWVRKSAVSDPALLAPAEAIARTEANHAVKQYDTGDTRSCGAQLTVGEH